jgi:hypothetical protein
MTDVSAALQPALRRLARRVTIGLFLDIWPVWATGGLLAAGVATVVCRLHVPGASPYLPWLWLAPMAAAVPGLIVCAARSYRPEEIAAVADALGGGHGMLLTLVERGGDDWRDSPLARRALGFPLPRLRAARRLAAVVPAALFLGLALWLPQRVPAEGMPAALADDIAADLTATMVELKQQELITPEEEQRLEEEIARIRQGAERRVDTSSWEAADSLREQVVAGLSAKHEALKWADESLDRYAAVTAEAAATGTPPSAAQSAELTKALERLAKSGMLAGAPPELQRLAAGGRLPADPAELRALTAELARHLGEMQGRFGDLARLGRGFGRFDPTEFPLEFGKSEDGDGRPGRGGINRGRGDAELTYGRETLPFDRFKSQALPPGAARSPDDWTPVMTLPGAPLESARVSGETAARQYAAAAGQAAWRRSLAPRHQSAVRKYFDKQR